MRIDMVKKIDFLNLSPYVRYVQENSNPDANKVPPRIIYDHEIIFFTEGEGYFKIDEEEFVLKPGDLHVIHPYVLNSSYVPHVNPFHYYAVHFDLHYMGEELDFSPDDIYVNIDYNQMDYVPQLDELIHRPLIKFSEVEFPAVIHTHDPHKYVQLFNQLLTVFQEKSYGYHLEMRAVMLQILNLMIKDTTTPEGIDRKNPHRNEIAWAIQYMYEHYKKELDINQLASTLHLSPNHFRVLFKAGTGKTTLEFLTNIRMEKAKEYLASGNYTLLQICEMIGYEDIHYFSRLFKKREGLSPKNYAESIKRRSIK